LPDDGIVSYVPPGPIAEQFVWSKSFFSGLMGPVGSGKSSAACWNIVLKGLQQKPYNGVRYTRWAVVRNTYPELKSTTIKTWQEWFPNSIAPMKWDTPIQSHLQIKDIGDGTSLDMEVLFLAIDRPEDVNKLRSLELTGAWINEASEIDEEILKMLTQRVGRYPAKKRGGHSWTGVIADTNPPDDDHWWYKFAEEPEKIGDIVQQELVRENYKFFRQPGAYILENGKYRTNPEAENIENLTDGYTYYSRQMIGKTEEWIKVFVLGEYGTTLAGKPVYPEWRDDYHLAKQNLNAIRGRPIVLAWDYGLTPACIVQQMTPMGQLVVLREFTSSDMGIRQFATEVVRPAVTAEWPRGSWRHESVGDPAGNQRVQTDEKTCEMELEEAGFSVEGAPTNEFVARREAVAYFLQRNVAGQPGFLLDPRCKTLRRGFNGRYRYGRVNSSGTSLFKDRPVKDEYSHPHDANQYGCLYFRSGNVSTKPITVQTRTWI
jgi:Phage terminase large subunit